MNRYLKIAIIAVLMLAVAAIYYGKNIYMGKGSSEQSQKLEGYTGMPVLLELSSQG